MAESLFNYYIIFLQAAEACMLLIVYRCSVV